MENHTENSTTDTTDNGVDEHMLTNGQSEHGGNGIDTNDNLIHNTNGDSPENPKSAAQEHAKRLSSIRSKFNNEEAPAAQTTKRQVRPRYAGLQSAKTKFIEDAKRSEAGPGSSCERRAGKQITPPPDDVDSADGSRSGSRGHTPVVQTKDILAKFKEIESGGGTNGDSSRENRIIDTEFSGAGKNMLAKWKDIETGKADDSTKSVKNRQEGEEENGEEKSKVIVNTRELRDRFLKEATDERRTNRVNPLEEIQELSKRMGTVVYENSPQERSDEVVSSNENSSSRDIIIGSNAKELRERFSNFNNSETEHRHKTPIEIKAEYGGVFENQPVKLDGVVRYDQSDSSDREPKGKWASEAKQRFMEASTLQKERQKLQLDIGEGGVYESTPVRLDNVVRYDEGMMELPTDLVKTGMQKIKQLQEQGLQTKVSSYSMPPIDINNINGGVFENQPSASSADVIGSSVQDDVGHRDDVTLHAGKYASDAKMRFVQKQRELEEAEKKKAPPKVINIWNELCEYSGVFENEPQALPEDIARCKR